MSCRAFPHLKPWRGARATEDHMPFKGHRTVAQIWAQQEAAARRAADYGFDVESLRKAAKK